MEHTKEPWERDGGDIFIVVPDRDGEAAQQLVAQSNADDARRIVACVNSCAGIETDALEINGSLQYIIVGMKDRLIKAESQRDELLAAREEEAKMSDVPYYKEYVENPDAPRPNEPCNDFEHSIRWARLAYWEKARADRLLAALKVALAYINDDDPVCVERYTRETVENAIKHSEERT